MKYLVVFTLAFVLVGCSTQQHPKESAANTSPAIAVTTQEIALADWPVTYEAVGTVRARVSAQISPRLMSYVRDVKVRAGDHVRAGQVLATLDAADMDAHVRQAEAAHGEASSAAMEAEQGIASAKASLELAESTYTRMKDLHDKRSLSNQEFDEATARLRAARAGMEMAQSRRKQVDFRIAQAVESRKQAEIQSGYTTLTAPFAGVVVARNGDPGTLGMPGQPLITLEQQGGYRLEAEVPESQLANVRLGQQVQVQLDSLSDSISGRVAEIVPAVDAASRSFTVKIELPASPSMRSGLFGRARFTLGARKTFSISNSAVVARGQMQWVFVAENQTARGRIVTLGERFGETVEVLSGLAAGERIIVPVPGNLTDGSRIEGGRP